MTLEDVIARDSIRQTMARYTMAGDRLQLEEFLAVFTGDAILESEAVADADAFRYEGVEQIGQWMNRWQERSRDEAAPTHQATFVRHHLSTSLIEFTGPDTAKVRTYWTAYTDVGPDHAGYYLDVFRKKGEQWLIAHRRIRLDWRSTQSLFTTAITRSQ